MFDNAVPNFWTRVRTFVQVEFSAVVLLKAVLPVGLCVAMLQRTFRL